MRHIDLRSDTVTRPSPEMRRAIAAAEVGDAVLGDDPTVDRLEAFAADMLGKERALFFPSGIMANLTAVMLHAPPGTCALIEAGGHILQYEEGGAAAVAGVQLRPIPTADGILSVAQVDEAVGAPSRYLPQTTLLLLENTHNSAGGRVLPADRLRALAEAARARGLAIHLDGARLPNAAVAAGVPMSELAAPVDTVMVSLSKGLGAPVGSVLAGRDEAMERAWRIRRRLGGGMRQAGLLAAAGLLALRENLPRLAEDHRRSRELAAGLRAIDGLDAAVPDTNIVMVVLRDQRLTTETLLDALARRGVRLTAFGPRRLRAVIHMDIEEADIARTVEAFGAAVRQLFAGPRPVDTER